MSTESNASKFGTMVFIAFMITAYIPDPIPLVDELGLGGILVLGYKELAVLAVIIMGGLMFFGIPPVGIIS